MKRALRHSEIRVRTCGGNIATLVEGQEFRCLAYRDPDGKWRHALHHRLLPEPVRIVAGVKKGD